MLAWLAAQAVGRAAREQLAQAQRVKAAMVAQALTWLLVLVVVVVVLVLLVRQRRPVLAAMAARGCRVRSLARRPFMAVERVAARTAAPLAQEGAAAVLLALRHWVTVTAAPMVLGVGRVAALGTSRVATAVMV
jgi:hypothetical protein